MTYYDSDYMDKVISESISAKESEKYTFTGTEEERQLEIARLKRKIEEIKNDKRF